MSSSRPRIVPMVNLVRKAGVYPGGLFEAGTYQSYPIPVPGPERLRVAFLFGESAVVGPSAGLQLGVPRYVGLLDAESGKFVELRGLTEEELGAVSVRDGWIGRGRSLDEQRSPEYLGQKLRLLQALDALLPGFAVGEPEPGRYAPEAVEEFASLFRRISEEPLHPYYRVVGARFFAWFTGQ